MAILIEPPANWNNIQGKPTILADSQIDWGEVQDKPLQTFNWAIAPPLDFVADTYLNLGSFPLLNTNFTLASGNSIFLIQFNLQWDEYYWHNIIASDSFSMLHWMVYTPVLRELKCEHHFTIDDFRLTYYLAEGSGYRNLFLKLNRNLSILETGAINIKIVKIT